MDKYKHIPVVLAGDFNDFPYTAPLDNIEKSFIDFYSLKAIAEKDEQLKKVDRVYPDFTLICDTRKAEVGPSVEHRCLDYMLI